MFFVTGKCRVAPLSGTTVQRMELTGLLQCSRMLKKVVEVLPFKIANVTIAGDSMCSIMAMRKVGASFKPFFQNRVAEIAANLDAVAKHVDNLEPLQKIDGKVNPADICTRDSATDADVGLQSTWICAPPFLKLPREHWPLAYPTDHGEILFDECRKNFTGVVTAQPADRLYSWVKQVGNNINSL